MTDSVRIRLNHSKSNQEKGLYLLLLNGGFYSDNEYEFVVSKSFLSFLKKKKVMYEELPLKKNDA